jgi:hypothetical protein
MHLVGYLYEDTSIAFGVFSMPCVLLENCAPLIYRKTWGDPKFSGLVPPSTQQLW